MPRGRQIAFFFRSLALVAEHSTSPHAANSSPPLSLPAPISDTIWSHCAVLASPPRASARSSSALSTSAAHAEQYLLPARRATDLVQPSCWQRLPPPCAMQWGVPPLSAPLVQPSSWHRLPPPWAMQRSVPPATADLKQPSCWHRLPPPCTTQYCVSPRADLEQPSCWHRLPPPCAMQWGLPPLSAPLVQPSSWHRLPPPCAMQCGVPPATADLKQSSCWQRFPPPCETQCCVLLSAPLMQFAVWHRLPPPCALHCCVPPAKDADLGQPSCWHRLPPPCAMQWGPAIAPLEQPSSSHGRLPMALLRARLSRRRQNPRTPLRARHTQPSPTPLSYRFASAHADGGSARAGQTLQHVSIKMVNSAWAGDVPWVCSRREWTGTPPNPPPPGSQAARACRFPALMAGSNAPHSTPLHGGHSTTEGHLGVFLLI
jgi:hypothetical protein